MGHFGAGELVIIAILVIVIFGGRKLPELGKGLGQGLANFRRAMREPEASNSSRQSSAEPSSPNTSEDASSTDKAEH